MPTYRPQLARLVKRAPEGDAWLHELKYDGYRIGCRIHENAITIISRNGKDWSDAFPEIVRAARGLGVRDALLDGEAAIVLPDGRTSFQALQNAMGGGPRQGLVYFVFDLLRVAGDDLLRRPLENRKGELLRLVGRPDPKAIVRYSEHVIGRGGEMFEEACRLRLEGIISKRRDAPYKAGRGDTWLKTKCVLRQEFVIGGFTDPEGSRQGIGALLVGYYDAARVLRFAGKVGTGFTVPAARELRRRLNTLERKECPFVPRPAGWLGKHAHWVHPDLVGEVAFTEWTADGKVRHPSFQGLRQDKDPRRVVRETPSDASPRVPRTLGRPPRPAAAEPRRAAARVAGIPITHPGRVLYPAEGVTKLQVAEYYAGLGDWILPHLRGRPLTLVRCPNGIGECFYMKHSKVWAPPALRRVRIQEKTKVGEYLIADTLEAVVSLVQMGVLEIHTWNTCIDRVERPNRLVLDLDPGAQAGWPAVIAAARTVRRLLQAAGLDSFVKTTGGRGLHVVAPLSPVADWTDCLAFAKALAVEMERWDPERYTTAFPKQGRQRKILVDYLRNNRTNTSVAAFSTRARPGAPVSMPLRWADITPALDPTSFTLAAIGARLRRLREDPWSGYWKLRQRLPRTVPWAP